MTLLRAVSMNAAPLKILVHLHFGDFLIIFPSEIVNDEPTE